MPKIIVLALLSLSITIANAECVSGGLISCWPTSTSIKKNSIFILNFNGLNQNIVSEIGKKYSVYLRSGEQKIPLKVLEINKGEFELTQVLLKPSSELIGGLDYELFIDSLPKYGRLMKWNNETKKLEKAKWIVSDNKDTIKPIWTELPKFDSKTMVEYGCGPEKWVNFSFRYSDSSNILIKATVKSLKTQAETTYYLEKDDNKIKIGHDMCSGAFHFDHGNEYEVKFVLMDLSGNYSANNSKPYIFSQPSEPTQSK